MAVGDFTPNQQDSVWMILERVDVPSAPGYTVTNNTDVTMTSSGMVTIDSMPWSKITGKPSIPADVSDLTDTTNLLSGGSSFSGDYNDLTNEPTYKVTVLAGSGPGGNNKADSLVLAGIDPEASIRASTFGGDLVLRSGAGGSYGDLFGDVRIQSGSNFEWQFTTDKKIKLPSGGDIVDSTGTSVFDSRVTKVNSSWTVTPGTNTYSFTLDINAAYNVWVRGNIPNGIITYIATISITNSNVPVIGTQYAWNYTGAGSPISLTSIPNQVIGTAGTISTATVATTTSNRFDFGISNTTGSNQTVLWGYTKIS